jgi:aspartyl protease family protein
VLACLALQLPAQGQTVSVNGIMGAKALLVIDGKPHMMSAGAIEGGVRLLSIAAAEVVVEIGGRKVDVPVGGSPVSLVPAGTRPGGSSIVLSAGSGGHFQTSGSINGRGVQFLVDTGASLVTLGRDTATRLGLDLRNAQPVEARTANGVVRASLVSLATLRIGDVDVYDVQAVVLPAPMDQVLLGNSYLSRFQMRRDNDQMTLTRRY